MIEPVLMLAPRTILTDVGRSLREAGIQRAVKNRDAAAIFDWIMAAVPFQGISDAVALTYSDRHGTATWAAIESGSKSSPDCAKLTSYWAFSGCGYSKGRGTCSDPKLLGRCPLPSLPLRKGALNQAAFSFRLFVQDVCDGDLVGWIDKRLSDADRGAGLGDRAAQMCAALLEPLTQVFGIGPKLWSMILADFLLGADPDRERWTTTGASMVAVDTLVHNFFHRTGILRQTNAEHSYGAACYGPHGCAELLDQLARVIDARDFEPSFPAYFPRWVQFAVWHFCAELGSNICNGRQIDDTTRCADSCCPAFDDCGRIPLRGP